MKNIGPGPIWKIRIANLGMTVLFWMAGVFLFSLIRFYGIEDTELFQVESPIVAEQFFVQSLLIGLVMGVLASGVNGLLEIPSLRKLSYVHVLALKSLFLVSLTLCVTSLAFWLRTRLIVSGFIPDSDLKDMVQTQLDEHRRVDALFEFLTGKNTLVVLVYVFLMSIAFNLISILRNNTGPKVLARLLMGKYYHPKEEIRIFMFLDMKDATTHAERLGHMVFSRLIQDCMRDLTEPVMTHQSEIVQYVGDEAMLTWDLKAGLKDANCLRIKFAFDLVLQKRGAYYKNHYGFIPEFKAGVHVGPVMVTEVGTLKREISYHGDVVNTAARIEGQCNGLGAKLLISAELYEKTESAPGLQFSARGALPLKGKENQVELYAVDLR